MPRTKKKSATPEAQRQSAGSKKEQLIELLRRDSGASIADMIEPTGWLPHTARAMLTGLRKEGHNIDKQKVDGVTCYSITSEPAA